MSNEQPSSRLDEAIDLAVRRIAAVDPEPGLAGRVRTRLAAPSRHPPGFAFRWAAAASVLAVVVLAVMTMPRERRGDPAGLATGAERASRDVPRAAEPGAPRAAAAAPPMEGKLERRAPQGSAAAERVRPPDAGSGDTLTRKADGGDIQAMAMAPPPAADPASPAAAKRSMAADAAAPERRAAAAVAATPIVGADQSLADSPRMMVAATPRVETGLSRLAQESDAVAAVAASSSAPDRLEIKMLSMPRLRIEPLQVTPIPTVERLP